MRLEAVLSDRIEKHALLELRKNLIQTRYRISNQAESLNCQKKKKILHYEKNTNDNEKDIYLA